jgi:hypothetical protein
MGSELSRTDVHSFQARRTESENNSRSWKNWRELPKELYRPTDEEFNLLG